MATLPMDFNIENYKYYNPDLYFLNNEEYIDHYLQIGKNEGRLYKKYNTIIQTMAKDEDHIINEWIVHHILLGFEHIFIYDDGSHYLISERIKELPKWIQEKVTVYLIDVDFYDKEEFSKSCYYDKELIQQWFKDIKQCYFLNLFNKTHNNISNWCLFCDLDEFIYLKDHSNISDFLKIYDNYDSLFLRWVCYNTSLFIEEPNGLIIDNYIYHHNYHISGKSITKMSAISNKFIHSAHFINESELNIFLFNQNSKLYDLPIHLNHYVKCSLKTFLRRKTRLEVGFINGDRHEAYNILNSSLTFEENNTRIMDKYIPKINEILKRPLNHIIHDYNHICPFMLFSNYRFFGLLDEIKNIDYNFLKDLLNDPNLRYAYWSELLPFDFDCQKYKYYNMDLIYTSEYICKKHYIEYGKKEGRIYKLTDLPTDFNFEKYKYYNPDLSSLSNVECEKHYIEYGKQEGRIYKLTNLPTDFNFEKYKYYNSDLFFLSKGECEKHYIEHGQNEGRIYKLD